MIEFKSRLALRACVGRIGLGGGRGGGPLGVSNNAFIAVSPRNAAINQNIETIRRAYELWS
jgi:hypothetical protein